MRPYDTARVAALRATAASWSGTAGGNALDEALTIADNTELENVRLREVARVAGWAELLLRECAPEVAAELKKAREAKP